VVLWLVWLRRRRGPTSISHQLCFFVEVRRTASPTGFRDAVPVICHRERRRRGTAPRAASKVDRGGAGVAGEMRLAREPGDVAGLIEDLRGVIGPTPLIWRRVVGCSSRTSAGCFSRPLSRGVETLELTKVVRGEVLAGLPDHVAGRTPESTCRALVALRCRFVPPGSAGRAPRAAGSRSRSAGRRPPDDAC
jgi:hypothetical protein